MRGSHSFAVGQHCHLRPEPAGDGSSAVDPHSTTTYCPYVLPEDRLLHPIQYEDAKQARTIEPDGGIRYATDYAVFDGHHGFDGRGGDTLGL